MEKIVSFVDKALSIDMIRDVHRIGVLNVKSKFLCLIKKWATLNIRFSGWEPKKLKTQT